ncbi:MAG TPA: sigma-70 family RNA polymerase sigma factor [Candidatus Limnocylindrales bacterium]
MTREPRPGDEDVLRRAATGDRDAFTRLVALHHVAMVRVAMVVTGDRELAEDAAQAAWATAWRRLGTIRSGDSVRSWLVAVAANEARMMLRARRRRPTVRLSIVDAGPPEADPGGRIAILDLEAALRGLDPADRVLLGLRFVGGLESAEIALHLGLSASGVRSRLSRLLQRLRTELDHA